MFDLVNFDKLFYSFVRPTKDMTPYVIQNDSKNKCKTIVHNAVGINPEDITVEISGENNTDYLTIKGETKDTVLNSTYSVNSRFSINSEQVEKIEYRFANGLIYVDVFFKEVQKPLVSIERKN